MMTSSLKNALTSVIFIMLSACAAIGERERPMLYKAAINDGEYGMHGWSVDTIEIDYENSVVRYSGGRIVTELSEFVGSEWLCISDGNLEFAIRKDWDGSSTPWTHQDMIYSIIEGVDSDKGEAYFILASPKQSSSRKITTKVYLYSKENGVLGINQSLRGRDGTLVSVSYIRVTD